MCEWEMFLQLAQDESGAHWGQWEDRRRGTLSQLALDRNRRIRARVLMSDYGALGYLMGGVPTPRGGRTIPHALAVHGSDTQSELTSEIVALERYANISEFYVDFFKHVAAITHWLRAKDPNSAINCVVNPPSVYGVAGILEHHPLALEPGSIGILRALRKADTEREDYRKAIINAEVIDFEPSETRDLTSLLRGFIEEYRDSNAPADLIAVGSAIRKFVAVAPEEEAMDFAAGLLNAGNRSPLPIEIEVEISKMVVRKLNANPPTKQDQYPELASRLLELAETYLNPRLLAREKHGAVAFNAVLGIVLTRDRRVSEVLERVRKLGVNWFQQVLARQAASLAADLRRRLVGEEHVGLLRSLEELIGASSPVSSK